MKKNIFLKMLVFISICIVVILIYKIINIYAVFHSDIGASIEVEKGVWNISLNGKRISTGIQQDFIIDQITITEDEHTMPGKISPGLTGKFKIIINPENTNVSIRYDITLDEKELKNSNIKISSVDEKANGAKLIKTAENVYTGIIELQDIQQNVVHEVEMTVEWADNGENDEEDTKFGTNKEERQLEIPVTFHAIQYLGEEIKPINISEKQE